LGTPTQVLQAFMDTLDEMIEEHAIESIASIGISCGGPLDSKSGIILSPPNLPGWDEIAVVALFRERFGVPVGLQNDANACALAEWKWGAGRGCRNMIFLTFGTGMGAGLILDGRLYAGTNDMAGEIGHIRMEKTGPVGYGKAGSFEGFCSGGGIAKLAQTMAWNNLQSGNPPSFCQTEKDLPAITTKMVGEAAIHGDNLALEIFEIVGKQLGRGIAVLVDILNPERIVIGSIYGRQKSILEPIVLEELRREALPYALAVCQIMPAQFKEQVGDFASLSVAMHTISA
jgi:glucokinase